MRLDGLFDVPESAHLLENRSLVLFVHDGTFG